MKSGWGILIDKLLPWRRKIPVPSIGTLTTELGYLVTYNKLKIKDACDLFIRPPNLEEFGLLADQKEAAILIQRGYLEAKAR